MNDLTDIFAKLGTVEVNRSLASMTTLHIGGEAAYVVYPNSILSLEVLLSVLQTKRIPFKVIGNGSNLLCSDKRYDGVIINLKAFSDSFFIGNDLIAQAGCSIIALSYKAMEEGLSGLEFASGIPGTVGGTVYMNAGAYLSDMSAILDSVFVFSDGQFHWMKKEECGFSYRTSIFQQHPDWIVLAVRMHLEPCAIDEIRSLMDSRRARRMASQPLHMPSAGSVFRNPKAHQAWKLIDGIGYRGHRIGGAMVSEKHGNFIVNVGGASAEDFLTLVEEIQQKIQEKYHYELHMEVEKFNW